MIFFIRSFHFYTAAKVRKVERKAKKLVSFFAETEDLCNTLYL